MVRGVVDSDLLLVFKRRNLASNFSAPLHGFSVRSPGAHSAVRIRYEGEIVVPECWGSVVKGEIDKYITWANPPGQRKSDSVPFETQNRFALRVVHVDLWRAGGRERGKGEGPLFSTKDKAKIHNTHSNANPLYTFFCSSST